MAAVQISPVAIAVDASNWGLYKTGTFSNCRKSINHAVVVVGFDSSQKYFIVRNSWGSNWGMNGFIRLKMNRGTCGMFQYSPYYPKMV